MTQMQELMNGMTGIQKIDFETIEKAKQLFNILNDITLNNSKHFSATLKNFTEN